jgi:hypothetical protein
MLTCFTKSWVFNNKGCEGVDINPKIEVFSKNTWTNDEEGPAGCWTTIETFCEKEKKISMSIGVNILVASLVVTVGSGMSTFLTLLYFSVGVTTPSYMGWKPTLLVSIASCDASRDVLLITALCSTCSSVG